MTQDVHIHITLKVVFRQFASVCCQYFIGDFDVIQYLIRLKQTTIIGKYLVVLALIACVHVAEILLHSVVERPIFVHLLQALPLVNNLYHRIGRQKSTIFSEEDEQQTIKELLRLLKKKQLPFFFILSFWSWIQLQDISKKHSFELRIVFIESLRNLVFTRNGFLFHLQGHTSFYLRPC